VVNTKQTLNRAMSAIDDARRRLKRAADDVDDDDEIRRAIRELDDAEADIRNALQTLGR